MFGDKPSICDLSLACELTNLEAINFDLAKFPEVNKWLYTHMMSIPEFKHYHEQGSQKLTRILQIIAHKKKKAAQQKDAKL